MINVIGIVKFPNEELFCYDSPTMEIVGQNTNENISLLNVALLLKSQSGDTVISKKLTIDATMLKIVSDNNNIVASYMVDNLYIMLESLLVQTLQINNPSTIFEIV